MVIADTGFWVALANPRDHWHERARLCLNELKEPLITTWPVLTETCHLLQSRIGQQAETAFMRGCDRGAFELFDLSGNHCMPITRLMETYADLPMDLADASLVLLAEHLGHGRILSTDQRDFHTYRWKQRAPFDNLLLSQERPHRR